MSIFGRLFGKRTSAKQKEDCCIKCGAKFSSPNAVKDPRLGLARFPGDVSGVLAGVAAICAMPAHVCPQCGGKLCFGCSPMAGRPACPKCKCEMN